MCLSPCPCRPRKQGPSICLARKGLPRTGCRASFPESKSTTGFTALRRSVPGSCASHEVPDKSRILTDRITLKLRRSPLPYDRGRKSRASVVPRQNLIRSKNSSISLFPIAKRLNTVRDGNEEPSAVDCAGCPWRITELAKNQGFFRV